MYWAANRKAKEFEEQLARTAADAETKQQKIDDLKGDKSWMAKELNENEAKFEKLEKELVSKEEKIKDS